MIPAKPGVEASAGSLHQFQDGFAQALAAFDTESLPPDIAVIAAQPGFAVYRNTVMKGCVDALQAHHPAVSRLVGDAWFRAAAVVYARANRPACAVLADYGDSFPQFLQEFPPAADMAYLADVARIERLWGQSLRAADAPTADSAEIAALAPAELATMILTPHPSARWAWFAHAPAVTIWQRNRDDAVACATATEADLAWHGEGMLFTRPGDTVQCTAADPALIAFMDACAMQATVADAAAAAMAADADVDLRQLFARLLAAHAFTRPTPNCMPSEDDQQ